MSYIDMIKDRARLDKKTIVLPESNDKRTLIAAAKIMEEGIANIIMIGNEEKITDGAGWLEVDLTDVRIVNPLTDPKFEEYYKACKERGIPVGAYYDCGKRFYLKEFGEDCARHFLKLLEGKSFEMPVFMDIEVTPKSYRTQITEATRGFCKLMEANDYFVGIYASDISGFKERLDYSKIQEFTKWVARYGREPEYVKSYGLYQYSSTGKIQGIKGNVDLDIAMADYPYIIKKYFFERSL